ncbi:translation initiation factor [Cryptococcus deuterogattii 2001/935-1]|nr:translation initiation factor [Cryptococcus deuterogattii 2001/935-1]
MSPSPPEFEASDAYLALLARLARTEAQVSALSAQVATLSDLVRSAIPARTTSNLPAPSPPKRPVFSPFDSDPPLTAAPSAFSAQPNSYLSAPPKTPTGTSPTQQSAPSISALTQQITALSTSVAQLQRLQHSQTQQQSLTRQPSSSLAPSLHPQSSQQAVQQQLGSSSLGGDRHPGSLSLGVPRLPSGGIDSFLGNNGPLTMPNSQPGGVSGTNPSSMPFGRAPSPNPNRPGMNRSFSSSVVQADGRGAHGHGQGHNYSGSGSHGHAHLSPGHLSLGGHGHQHQLGHGHGLHGHGPSALSRDWPSPGGQQQVQSGQKDGSTTPGGAAAPGGGIVVPILSPKLLPLLNESSPMVRGVGGPIGIRSAVAAGAAGSSNVQNEIAQMQRDQIHLLVGTPAKICEVMTARGGLGGGEVRLLILIARNLYENVLTVVKHLPPPRGFGGALTPGGPPPAFSPGLASPYDAGQNSPFNPASKTPFPNPNASHHPSRFGAPGQGAVGSSGSGAGAVGAGAGGGTGAGGESATSGGLSAAGSTSTNGNGIERQTCLFSNTIPTDVINFSQSLQVRDPVRVLVRREGGANSQESVSSVTPGVNLKHTYVYLTITGNAQQSGVAPVSVDVGPGTIGSGRIQHGQQGGKTSQQLSEEQTRAKEYKLDMLVKILDDYPLWQAIVHVGSFAMLEAVVYKLQTRNWETLYLTPEMPNAQKKAILQQWRISVSGSGPRFLVVFDVNVKPPEVPWSPLVINFDLPRSVEGYAQRAAAAVPPASATGSNGGNGGGGGGGKKNRGEGRGEGRAEGGGSQGQGQGQSGQVNGVIVSFVQAAGGDVEMLRSTECAYRFKSAEIPTVFHDLFQH